MPDGHRALTISLVFWVSPDYFHDYWLWVLHLSHHISSVTTAGEVTNRFSLGSSSQKLTFYLPDVPPFDLCQRLGHRIDDKHSFKEIIGAKDYNHNK